MPSWLKAAIRSAVIAAALGGGLFVLSQALSPSQAHAETVTPAAGQQHSLQAHAPAAAVHRGAGDAPHRPVATVVRHTSAAADKAVDATTHTLGATLGRTTDLVGALATHAVAVLPAPLQSPVAQVAAPVVQAAQQVTAPAVTTLDAVGSAHPVSTTVRTTVSTVAHTVGAVTQPLLGTIPVPSALPPATGSVPPATGSVAPTPTTVLPASVTASSGAIDPLAALTSDQPAFGALPDFTGPFAGAGALGTQATRIEPVAAAVAGAASGAPVLPALPGAPGSSGAALAGAGSSAGGSSGGNGSPSALALTPTGDTFTPLSAGTHALITTDALHASPVFEHDSTPD